MEKVIGEFKIVETEEGYRIEIKGDKEKDEGDLLWSPVAQIPQPPLSPFRFWIRRWLLG